MIDNSIFSNETFICFAVLAVIGLAIPLAAALIWKKKLKKGDISPIVLGALMFFLFAMVLESLLHMAMLPVVKDNVVLYCVYGALAAGLFEETARFLCYKILMKKNLSAENAVSYGIGHGGFEIVAILTISSISAIVMGILVNANGTDAFIESVAAGDIVIAEQLLTQVEAYSAMNIPQALLAVFERIVALTFHISISVIVMEAAKIKGKAWLYPAAIVLHALLDVPAVLYQQQLIPMWMCFVIMTIYTGIIACAAVKRYKYLKTH